MFIISDMHNLGIIMKFVFNLGHVFWYCLMLQCTGVVQFSVLLLQCSEVFSNYFWCSGTVLMSELVN